MGWSTADRRAPTKLCESILTVIASRKMATRIFFPRCFR
jgi:hypothetical protein